MPSPRTALPILFGLLSLVGAQAVGDIPACGQTCYSDILAKAGSFGCPADVLSCLCAKPDFHNGIHDCAVPKCAVDVLPTVVAKVNDICAAAGVPASAPPASTPPPATSEPPPTPTPTTSTTPVAPASSTPPTSSPSSAASTTTVISAPSSTTKSGTSSGTGAAASETTSSSTTSPTTPAAASSSSAGLSSSTKIGIGVGASAGAVALIALVTCLVVSRRHKNKTPPGSPLRNLKISDPMPGSGRTYANDHHHQQYQAGMSDLEMSSRRYEDMVPRQSPRTMV